MTQVATEGAVITTARRIALEGPGGRDPYNHFARVRLHLEDIQQLHHQRDRRARRNVIDRLFCTRLVSLNGVCWCTPEARRAAAPHRFDAWVHAHHPELNDVVGALFDPDQRLVLIDAAERYQSDAETGALPGAPPVEGLRFIQDWLFAPVEKHFRRRYAEAAVRAQARVVAPRKHRVAEAR